MYYKDMLMVDVKILRDVAKILDIDGRFDTLPSTLNGIADDICSSVNWFETVARYELPESGGDGK